MLLKKYVKRTERVLAFQFTDLEQAEVKEAVELGLAEIVSCYLGGEYKDDYLFIKTAVNRKTGKSRWTNIHNKECVVIDYIQFGEKEIRGVKAKKISEDALFSNYRPDLDEPTLFEKVKERFVDHTDGKITTDENGEEIIEIEIDKLNKKRNSTKKKA